MTAGSGAANPLENAEAGSIVHFNHDFFGSCADLCFRLAETGEPVAILRLGNHDAVLPLAGIQRQYGIGRDTPDGIMLKKVAEGLKFVREMKRGDALPKEIITRQASWSPKEKHFIIARHRLTMQMVTWVTGAEHIFTSVDELSQIVEDPAVKKNVSRAFSEAARELGIGEERREEVTHLIEQLAGELACIESLRDTFAEVKVINGKVTDLRRIYSSDKGMLGTSDQIARLMQRAIKMFKEKFEEVDAQTGEIMAMLKNIDNQINYIRTVRDDLFCRFSAWEDIIKQWGDVYSVKSSHTTARLHEIYRFLAPRYMQINEWELLGKRGVEKSKEIGGTMRW
ncbi:MAG: hypothetical protein FD119_3273 [Stygiobacter sp.]|nr:MAG: hypothetical protein FD119_3273 [Stygiobacter sp.]